MTEDAKTLDSKATPSFIECFIIMPISTPESAIHLYNRDPKHFKHVLDCLFIPALEEANMKAIEPIAIGAELIQGRTIKYIEQCDLLLCDISTYNANVFFELGIRTAINKPICLVKDDCTILIPFDTSAINHYTYESSLNTWNIQKEISRLAEHIKVTFISSKQENDLWKYFGIKTSAAFLKPEIHKDEQFSYLARQIDSLRDELRGRQTDIELFPQRKGSSACQNDPVSALERLMLIVKNIAGNKNTEVSFINNVENREILVKVSKGQLPLEAEFLLADYAREYGFKIEHEIMS